MWLRPFREGTKRCENQVRREGEKGRQMKGTECVLKDWCKGESTVGSIALQFE